MEILQLIIFLLHVKTRIFQTHFSTTFYSHDLTNTSKDQCKATMGGLLMESCSGELIVGIMMFEKLSLNLHTTVK